jgi:DNA polymerase III alpha subunit
MIPLFKSHYSILKSILTLDPYEKDRDKDLPDSIIDIAVENNLKEVCLVEDTMAGFLAALTACKASGIKLIFGLRLSFVNSLCNENGSSALTSHKNIIFPKNVAGYKSLIKIATKAAHDNFEKEPRLTYADLHEYWSDDLTLAIPFYDSFLHKNLLQGSLCIPEFKSIKPTIFLEENNLPFDYLIREACLLYSKINNLKTEEVKSIYYKNKEDYDAYVTLKCLNRKQFGSGRTLDNPGLEHMSSRDFSWESFKEKQK